MGLEVGQRQENSSEPRADLKALLKERALLVAWHEQHPNFNRLYELADAAVDKTNANLRMYNKTKERLGKRIADASGDCNTLPLVASLKRVDNLIAAAKESIPIQVDERNTLANSIYEWNNLPLLNEEIAQAKRQRSHSTNRG